MGSPRIWRRGRSRKADFVHVKKDGYDELWHKMSDDNIRSGGEAGQFGDRGYYPVCLSVQRLSIPGGLVPGYGAADLVEAALEPAEDVLADEYPVADPYDDHLYQPVLLRGDRGGDDHLLYQPV